MNKNLLINKSSTFVVTNIFHLLMLDVLKIGAFLQKEKISKVENMLLLSVPIDKKMQTKCTTCAPWRIHVLKGLVTNLYVSSSEEIYKDLNVISSEQYLSFETIILQNINWPIVYSSPILLEQKTPEICQIIDNLKKNLNVDNSLRHVKLVTRTKTRILLDKNSLKPIETILINHGVECGNFDLMTPAEQIEFVQDAKILIMAHGAGMSNIIFTHQDCIIIEISLRLIWRAEYWKYDYINLCKHLGKTHIELSAIGCYPEIDDENLPFINGTITERNTSDIKMSLSEKHSGILLDSSLLVDTESLLNFIHLANT
jgi:hypothetical protein